MNHPQFPPHQYPHPPTHLRQPMGMPVRYVHEQRGRQDVVEAVVPPEHVWPLLRTVGVVAGVTIGAVVGTEIVCALLDDRHR